MNYLILILTFKLFGIACFTVAIIKFVSSDFISEKIGYILTIFLMCIFTAFALVYIFDSAMEFKKLIKP